MKSGLHEVWIGVVILGVWRLVNRVWCLPAEHAAAWLLKAHKLALHSLASTFLCSRHMGCCGQTWLWE